MKKFRVLCTPHLQSAYQRPRRTVGQLTGGSETGPHFPPPTAVPLACKPVERAQPTPLFVEDPMSRPGRAGPPAEDVMEAQRALRRTVDELRQGGPLGLFERSQQTEEGQKRKSLRRPLSGLSAQRLSVYGEQERAAALLNWLCKTGKTDLKVISALASTRREKGQI
jgi:hypothetical protein